MSCGAAADFYRVLHWAGGSINFILINLYFHKTRHFILDFLIIYI